MPEAVTTILESLKKSPQLLVTFLIVGLFLMYMDKRDRLEIEKVLKVDLVSTQRIAQCHQTQERATAALDKLDETLQTQALAYQELSLLIHAMRMESEANTLRIERTLERNQDR